MSEIDIEELFKFGVMIPKSKLRREFNQWLRWVEKYPEHSVIVTRNNVSIATLKGRSDTEENQRLPESFLKDILIAVEEMNSGEVTEYKFGK